MLPGTEMFMESTFHETTMQLFNVIFLTTLLKYTFNICIAYHSQGSDEVT